MIEFVLRAAALVSASYIADLAYRRVDLKSNSTHTWENVHMSCVCVCVGKKTLKIKASETANHI